MPPVGFEPTISAGERSKTYALDRAATGTGTELYSTAFNETILFCDYLRKHKTGYNVNKLVIIFVTDETSINLDCTKSINFVQSLASS